MRGRGGFDHQVKPLLAQHCADCHGGDHRKVVADPQKRTAVLPHELLHDREDLRLDR
ncbi:MAG: hypothetical protein HC888_15890, partial [Candidatus Competibacteraceae bacterium]|nr:hypothetical protein [Candidatus Competibacteraceae bacterium]